LRDGREVVLLVRGRDILVATLAGDRVQRSWHVTSETTLAEVQLAEPIGRRLVLVMRAYTDVADEFVVLVLDRQGLVQRFATASDEWAEAAPLGRFRTIRNRLYRLGSNASGAFVDRYELETR
jgi:hypothetical protein